ncbi:hypothetical protein E8E14_012246 [Neopestalotiopsis sp. 37M]|nr:hypothetical protein E8E14_012246 [Neopestalotiopsis sp. 37M]
MSPIRSHGAAFAPLPTWQEEEEPVTPQPGFNQPHYNQPHGPADHVLDTYTPYGPAQSHGAEVSRGQYGAPPSAHDFMAVPPAVEGTPIADAHMRNPSHEIDDFSHAYTPAVGQTRMDDDQQPLTSSAYPHDFSHGYMASAGQYHPEDSHGYMAPAGQYHPEDSHGYMAPAGQYHPEDSHGYMAPAGQYHPQETQQPPTSPTQHYSESDHGGGTHRSGDRPLWQQNIRGSRNLTWM